MPGVQGNCVCASDLEVSFPDSRKQVKVQGVLAEEKL